MKGGKDKKERSVDWDHVRRRIEASRNALEKEWSPSEAEKRRILKARARALAELPEKGEAGEQIEIVEFVLSNEKYGVETAYVREVCPIRDFTSLPCTPAFVLGIISVRGEIHSIIDLRKFFGLPGQGLGDLNRVILLSSEETGFGILADAISGVCKAPLQGLLPPPPTFTGLRREYLKGIGPDGIAILDGAKILSDKRIIVNEFV